MAEKAIIDPPWWRPVARAGAVVLPVVVCALLALARDQLTTATSVLVLVLVVVGAAATGDRFAGTLAALASGASFDYFLTEPYLRFTIDDRDDVEATVLLVLIGLAVTEVALWGYRQQERAARQAGYLDGVLGAASAVAAGEGSASTIADVVAREIAQVLDADDCRYQDGPVRDARWAVLDHEGELTRGGRRIDVDRGGLPTDEYVALPVRRGSVTTGHFLVTAATRTAYPSRERRRVAALLADQIAGLSARSTGES